MLDQFASTLIRVSVKPVYNRGSCIKELTACMMH